MPSSSKARFQKDSYPFLNTAFLMLPWSARYEVDKKRQGYPRALSTFGLTNLRLF